MHKIDTNFGNAFACGYRFHAANCQVDAFCKDSGLIFGKLHSSIIAYSYDRLNAENVEFNDKIIAKALEFARGNIATVEQSTQRIDRVIVLSLQGYNTVTTRARLNGICQALNCTFSFCSRDYNGYILHDGKLYDSITIRVAGLLIVATTYLVHLLTI
jgi:hypothetical protein